ncbi:MAG: hypothetical protein LBS14_01795 [Holosporaceae bacterium]|jgi:hypothetical protein|nr:hypothetical protein [Holosporaceae bacterium]
MNLETCVQAGITLWDDFFSRHLPFDLLMAKFFKNNRWIGSQGRREIAEFSYFMFRNFEKLTFLTGNMINSRLFALGVLRMCNQMSEKRE